MTTYELRGNQNLLVVRDAVTGKEIKSFRLFNVGPNERFVELLNTGDETVGADRWSEYRIDLLWPTRAVQGPLISNLPRSASEIRFSEEGDLAIVSTKDDVVLMDAETGDKLASVPARRIRYTPVITAHYVLIAMSNPDQIWVWDRKQRQAAASSPVPGKQVMGAAAGDTVLLWTPSDRKPRSYFAAWNLRLGKKTAELGPRKPLHDRYIPDVLEEEAHPYDFYKLSRDGTLLAFIHSAGPHLEIWNVREGVLLSQFDVDRECRVWDFSPDGEQLLVWNDTRGVEMRETASGRLLWMIEGDVTIRGFDSRGVILVGTEGDSERKWIVDTKTGQVQDSYLRPLCRGGSTGCVSRNRRFTIRASVYRERGELTWLNKAMRFAHSRGRSTAGTVVDRIVVLEDQEFTSQVDPDVMLADQFIISNDGRLCATAIDCGKDGALIQGWALPRHKPWHWIIGIPLGLGTIVAIWRIRSYRKQKRLRAKRPNHLIA
ncbi:MAG: WD40 repeat domain-containing protein [Planctomycetes bacterium]|nr:WD40 repeat domain-containing protein [Planctomycetota bacterium]